MRTESLIAASHSTLLAPSLPITQVVYASVANQEFSVDQLAELLTKARARNSRAGVTGLLLYHDGSFLQLLEGPSEAVDSIFQLIEADPRHTGIHVLLRARAVCRDFEEWSMGFVAPETLTQSRREREGYIDYVEELCLHLLDETRAKRLIRLFREGDLRERVLV